MSWILLALLALQVSPTAKTIQSQIPKPTEGKALLVFFRLEEAQAMAGRKPDVKINGKEFAKFPEETWLALSVPPATYKLKMRQKQSEFEFSAEAGKIYFIHISQIPTGYFFRQSISFAAEEQARAWIRNLKPLAAEHVEKNLEYTRLQ